MIKFAFQKFFMTDLVKHSGQVFTPDYLVNLILDEAGYFGKKILRKHCIDNSCGDGAFLCQMVRRYCAAYRQAHGNFEGVGAELKEFIHGIEIDPIAYNCCKDNLSALFHELGINNADIDLALGDALKASHLFNKMDYVIGNPPYVRVHNLEENFEAVKSFSFANGGMTDLYLVFFEIGLKMLNTTGKLCYITPSSWINSVAGAAMRLHILANRNLISVIDLEHFQPFKATTYTMISLFEKKGNRTSFSYSRYISENNSKSFIDDIPFDEVAINSYFYLADRQTLGDLREIMTGASHQWAQVKNGFATLADKVFISDKFPFDEFVIPTIKASTGKWYKAFYPYDSSGKPLSKEKIFSVPAVHDYLISYKEALLKGQKESQNPQWFYFGRTQALKDVYQPKLAVNTCIKDLKSIKVNPIPPGAGLYSGLYILSDIPFEYITDIILSDRFVNYIASLKKYKSGGYYTFNSKDLEVYINYQLTQKINHGEIRIEASHKQGVSDRHLSLF